MKLIEITNCIKPNDFCQKNELMNEKCFGKYKIQCETKSICTNNKKYCEIFDLKSNLSNKKVIGNKEKYLRIVNYHRKTIPKCKDYTNKYCLNRHDCLESNQLVVFGITIKNEIKKVDCKCQGDFKYKCNENYCTNDLDSCKMIYRLEQNKVKDCTNRKIYTVIQKKNRIRY